MHAIDSGYFNNPSEVKLARKMLGLVDQKAEVEFINYQHGNIRIYEVSAQNEHIFDSPFYSGSIVISNVILNDNQTLGSYYLAVNCGNNCSAGFLVFIKRTDKQWIIDNQVLLWEG